VRWNPDLCRRGHRLTVLNSVAWLSHLETGYRRPTPATREALRAVGFVSDLDVRHQVEVVEAVAVPVATVDPDDEPLGSWA